MVKSVLIRFAITVFFVIALLIPQALAGVQCGTYFRSDYRAVDKIRRYDANGGNFELDDWTGDGRSDFWNFRYNQSTQTSEIVIYPALPAGYWNWDSPIIISTSFNSQATTVNTGCCFQYVFRDFDSDGRIDILAYATIDGNTGVRIHRNTGNGALVPQAPLTAITRGSPIDYYDVTGDGRLDWIHTTASGGISTINYAPQNSDGSFGSDVPILTHTPENELNNSNRHFGDFDGDGRVDIAYFGSGDSSRVRVLRNMGGGTFMLGNLLNLPGMSFFGWVADVNNDGRSDIVADTSSSLTVFFGQSDLTFQSSVQPVMNTSPQGRIMPPTDFNNDGRLDLIRVDNDTYQVFINNGAGGFTSQFYPRRLRFPSPTSFLHFEDFNADGKADVYDSRHELFNTFNEEVVVIKSNVCASKGQTRAMEFSSASVTPDIVTWNGTNGQWRYADGQWNATGTTPIQSFNWGLASLGDVPAPGDFDGDGRTDHTVYRNGEGNWYTFLSATSTWSVFRFGLPGDIPIPNDYNGGGKTDYAVFRPSDGNWHTWYNETQEYSVVHWGANGDRPVPADFDGDGKVDIGVFRPSEGNWYYVRSSDSGYGIFHWGTTGDIPLPADYDGDGKADLAVYRAGTWYVLRSSNGAIASVNWGTGGDIPLPYMEFGELAVPVVYRPSNSRWYSPRYPVGYALLLSGPPVLFGLSNN